MGEQRNLTEENVKVLTKTLKEMQTENPGLEYRFMAQADKEKLEALEISVISTAKALCEKFVEKVETGRARSRETYSECKTLLKMIKEAEDARSRIA